MHYCPIFTDFVGGPDVIPFQINGSADVDLTKVPAGDLMAWGLANLSGNEDEKSYAVRHGSQPVCDFGRPRTGEVHDPHRDNFFEKAYPCLFPYGRGGMEADQPINLDLSEHVRWALQYHDRRFRRHVTFPFVAFGILQRREGLASARVQMRRHNFEHDARIMSTITAEKLEPTT